MRRSVIKAMLNVYNFTATCKSWAILWDCQSKEPKHQASQQRALLYTEHTNLTLGESSSRVRSPCWKQLQTTSPNSKYNLYCAEVQNLRRAHFWGVRSRTWSLTPIQISFLQPPVPSSADTQVLCILWMKGRPCRMGRCIPDCTSQADNLLQCFQLSQMVVSCSKPGSASPPLVKNKLSLLFWKENISYTNPSSLDTLSN